MEAQPGSIIPQLQDGGIIPETTYSWLLFFLTSPLNASPPVPSTLPIQPPLPRWRLVHVHFCVSILCQQCESYQLWLPLTDLSHSVPCGQSSGSRSHLTFRYSSLGVPTPCQVVAPWASQKAEWWSSLSQTSSVGRPHVQPSPQLRFMLPGDLGWPCEGLLFQ